MLPIPALNVPQDAGQLEAFINQAVSQYFGNFGPGLLGQNSVVVNSSTGGAVTLGGYSLSQALMNGSLRGARLRAWGVTANNVNAKTINLVLGGGSISLSQALTTSTANPWEIEAIILAAGASPSPKQSALWTIKHGAAILSTQQSTAGTEVTTAPIPLLLTASTTTGNADIVCNGSLLELLQ